MIEPTPTFAARTLAAFLALAFATTSLAPAAVSDGKVFRRGAQATKKGAVPKALDAFTAPDGRKITLYNGYLAQVVDKKHHTRSLRYLPRTASLMLMMPRSRGTIPDRRIVLAELAVAPRTSPFVNGEVVAVLRPGVRLVSDDVKLSKLQLASVQTQVHTASPFAYSNDVYLNRVLSQFATREGVHLFAPVAGRLSSMRMRAANSASILAIENTYVFHITRGRVRDVVAALRALPSVAYAGENPIVGTMNTVPIPLPSPRVELSRVRAMRSAAFSSNTKLSGIRVPEIPSNYDVAYSGQSFLNAPGTNAMAAYDEISSHFRQLPGSGEIITNVSLGDIDDGLAPNDPCTQYINANSFGPTALLIGNQHYLSLPSMPLIPAYTADSSGEFSGTGEVCGVDPVNGEIGLDFSVMAALPHQLQRPGQQGNGLSDLMGIAPGAQYRLVVPASASASLTDLAGAFIAAASQNPQPNVITASLGLGDDAFGFPDRYLEEDPVMRSVVASIVAQGIVVCIASGDGLRTFTNAAAGPSGGTVPIDVVTSGGTDPNDDQLSTIPSAVIDSGSIAVGGTTLDDVTVNPPYWSENASYRDQQTYPEVRWDGLGAFASAFGKRVNISAPSDNILSVEGFATASEVSITGGTSASAPMVAAAAAVALQVARATGKPFSGPSEVRKFLISTATDVPNVAQADQSISVGPQLNVGRAVEELLKRGGIPATPGVARIAVAQRYPVNLSDFTFTTDTDVASIDLTGQYGETQSFGACEPGCTAVQPITIAPDWEELPPGTTFKLDVDGKPIAAPNPWARLYPEKILRAAGLPLYSAETRKVAMTYRAYQGRHLLAEASTVLAFRANAQTLTGMGPPPLVPAVVTGDTIPVRYDLSTENPSYIAQPTLYVSVVDRASIAAPGFHVPYSVALTGTKGTVNVPVSALQGDGIYGFAISANHPAFNTSTWSYTRVARAGSARPAAPLLSSGIGGLGTTNFSGHILDVPYGGSFQVTWDASNVSKATGAMLEIAAPGPTLAGNYNAFNNPNGSVRDDNGIDTGSQVYVALPGVKGTTTISSSSLLSAEYQAVRVIPMDGSRAAGEAGDESTIVTHGIQTSDGGNVVGGFEINPLGTDGMLTSNSFLGSVPGGIGCTSNDVVTASLQAINLGTSSVGATVKVNSQLLCEGSLDEYYAMNDLSFDPFSDSAFALEGPLRQNIFNGLTLEGVAASDFIPNVASFASEAPGWSGGDGLVGFTLADPISQQAGPGNSGGLGGAENEEFIFNAGPNDPQIFPATIAQGSLTWGSGTQFGNYSGIQPIIGFAAVNGGKYPSPGNPGYAIFTGDTLISGEQPVIDVLNLTTGKASIITNLDDVNYANGGPGTDDFLSGLALVPNGSNPPQYVAAAAEAASSVGFYDFAAGTLFAAANATGFEPAAITSVQGASGIGYVAVLSAIGPNWLGSGSVYFNGDDNALSGVDIIAPNGADSFIATSNLGNLPITASPDWIGFNQKTQTLYVLGPGGDEIQVIPTSGF